MPLFNPGLSACYRYLFLTDVCNSGDMESGTRVITATAEASGVGNADYSWSRAFYNNSAYGGLAEILRVVARLTLTIDSKTAGTLYCRIYVDAQDDAHRLIDAAFTSTGAVAAANDCASDKLQSIFTALTDGTSHTFYIFLWVDSGQAVISEASLACGVGSCDTTTARAVFKYKLSGLAALGYNQRRYGTGTPTSWVGDVVDRWVSFTQAFVGHDAWVGIPSIVMMPDYTGIIFGPTTVANDMNYIRVLYLYLLR